MGRSELIAQLFVGSRTKRSMIEWLKVFKIVDDKSIIEEIKQSDSYIAHDKYEEDNYLLENCVNYIDFSNHLTELDDTLTKLNLKYSIDGSYEEYKFYIGRIVKDIREDISSDIWFWQQYNITDVDIFASMYSVCGGLEYTLHDDY